MSWFYFSYRDPIILDHSINDHLLFITPKITFFLNEYDMVISKYYYLTSHHLKSLSLSIDNEFCLKSQMCHLKNITR